MDINNTGFVGKFPQWVKESFKEEYDKKVSIDTAWDTIISELNKFNESVGEYIDVSNGEVSISINDDNCFLKIKDRKLIFKKRPEDLVVTWTWEIGQGVRNSYTEHIKPIGIENSEYYVIVGSNKLKANDPALFDAFATTALIGHISGK